MRYNTTGGHWRADTRVRINPINVDSISLLLLWWSIWKCLDGIRSARRKSPAQRKCVSGIAPSANAVYRVKYFVSAGFACSHELYVTPTHRISNASQKTRYVREFKSPYRLEQYVRPACVVIFQSLCFNRPRSVRFVTFPNDILVRSKSMRVTYLWIKRTENVVFCRLFFFLELVCKRKPTVIINILSNQRNLLVVGYLGHTRHRWRPCKYPGRVCINLWPLSPDITFCLSTFNNRLRSGYTYLAKD